MKLRLEYPTAGHPYRREVYVCVDSFGRGGTHMWIDVCVLIHLEGGHTHADR